MSDPEKNVPPKLPGELPVHSERPFAVDEQVENPLGQQRPITAHISAHGQEDTPLVLQESNTELDGRWVVITPDPEKIRALAKRVSMTVFEAKGIQPVNAPQPIEHPPATRYISILRSALTDGAYSRIIAPYVAQEQHEYYEALLQKDTRQAKVIKTRMYLLLTWLSFRALVSPVIRLIKGAG